MKFSLEKYDKIIWRVVGGIVILAAMAVLLIVIFIGYMMIKDMNRRSDRHDIVNVDEKTQEKVFLNLGYADPMPGGEYIRIPLYQKREKDLGISSYKGGYSGTHKNMLIVETKSKELSWMFPHNKYTLFDVVYIHDKVEDKVQVPKKTLGLLFEAVTEDRNQDGQLTSDDGSDLYYYDLKARKMNNIIKNTKNIMAKLQISDQEVLVMYSQGGLGYSKIYNFLQGTDLGEKKIEIPQ